MDLAFIDMPKAKIKILESKNITSCEDLAEYFPKSYRDYRNQIVCSDVKDEKLSGSIAIRIKSINNLRSSSGRPYLSIVGYDINKNELKILYFNSTHIARFLKVGKVFTFCGTITINEFMGNRSYQMINPYHFGARKEEVMKIYPEYKKIKGISESALLEMIKASVNLMDRSEILEPVLLHKFDLENRTNALTEIHMPKSMEEIERAKNRFLFDDLFYYNYELKKSQSYRPEKSKYHFVKYDATVKYRDQLPFVLTKGQKQALHEICVAFHTGKPLNALVLGDVGCGKTEIAKISMLMAHDNGYQAVMMAPTNVLARQHYQDLKRSFEPLGIKVGFLSSETKSKERKSILNELKEGTLSIVVGTHSLLSDEIIYKDLALAIIDEQHKFGVKQRESLSKKIEEGIHCISMSATPIPRTLAMSLYGDDIKVLAIKELPNGRKPILTKKYESNERALRFIAQEVKKGHQAYIVCPLIEESENEKLSAVVSVTEAYKECTDVYQPIGIRCGLIHGKMKQDEIQQVVTSFEKHEIDVLVSTTIVEVGVNVPNATIIYVRNAERFGLAQLHQLRGRVGRSSTQSYCILQSDHQGADAIYKIQSMCETNDGYEIAKRDLQLRGPGDFIGTAQSKDNRYVSLMLAYPQLNSDIKKEIDSIFTDSKRKMHYNDRLSLRYKKELEKN